MRITKFSCLILLGWLGAVAASAQLSNNVIISEFMANNATGITNNYGSHDDWIELYNAGSNTVNLADWCLTDNASKPTKWAFPSTNLAPARCLIVWASGKDIRTPGLPLHTSFKLGATPGGYLGLRRPDLSVATEFAPTYPAQTADISYGFPQSVATNPPVYFLTPTPGATNNYGTTNLGPVVTQAAHTPHEPLSNQTVIVTARILPTLYAVSNVTLIYRVMFSNEVTLLMNDAGTNGDAVAGDNIYSAILPAGLAKPGQMVRYAIITRDTRGNAMRSPEYLTTRAPQYYGFMIADPSLFSPVPIFHWFIQDFNAAAYDSPGAQAAFYFNGQFFDNVNNTIHGQSSTGFPKHSYNFNLNPGYKLTINPGIPNVGDFAILSTYADRSYMRNMVADDTYNMAGSPGHYAFAVRVQTNGSYFALQNLTEQGNEDFLQRIGFDPNGALYKIYNTLNVVAGNEKKTRKWEGTDDLQALINAVTQIDVNARLTYVYDNVNIPEVISFLSAKAINMDHDCCHKNHYLYHDNDGTGEWYAFAWDVDLSFGHVWTGNNGYYFDDTIYTNLPPFIGNNQTLFAVLYADPVLRSLWARRIRTDMDTILQPPGTPTSNDVMRGMMEYYAGLVRDEAALDRAKWPGTIWSTALYPPGNPTSDFSIELSRIENNFLSGRRAFLFINQVTNNAVLPQAQPTNTTILFGSYEYNPASSNQAQEYVELLNTNNYAADISGWKLDGGVGFTFKPGTVIPARSHIYVSPDVKAFRARTTGPRGGQQLLVVGPYSGQLSARGESLVLVNTAGRTNSTLSFPGAPSLAQQFLRITEIMYNPPAPLSGSYTAQDFEYIELKNISTYATLDLNGVTLTAGVDFAFTGSAVTTLAPGQRVLVVKNAAAFASRYGAGLTIAGTFTGSLDNAGERLRLLDASNEEILDFSYNNSWYPMTDGQGFSLVIANELAEPDAWDTAAGWRTSATVNGAPGREDMTPPVIAPILVNELLPRPTPPGLDTVELYNSTATNVDIGGWFLTDSFGTPKKWRIPNGTTIAAGGYLVFTESEFNPGGLNFSYSSLGEEVYLFSGNASNDLTGYYHGFVYDAADEGVSFGRYLNSQAKEDFVAQTSTTFGTNNAGPIVGPVVINEIMYHPAALTTNDSSTSFIELLNITATNVALYNLSQPSNTWHLRNAADFDFPTNLTLLPGGKIVVVGFDPAADATSLAAFRSRYSLSTNVPLYGPWQGNLPNNESVIELKKPDLATTTNDAPYVVVEKVHYHDSAPWPCGADGTGLSLQRQQPAGYGNEPNNWAAAAPTPASNNVVVAPIAPVVTVPPAAQTAAVGGTAIFTVTACGSPQFYQWRLQGTNLPAATNAALVLANAQASQAGSYSVVVWNSGGSVTSAPALLSVLIPPYFTEQPQTVTVNQTSNATFHVAVSGDSPIFIQWLFNGTNLPNATNATLTLTNIQISQDGPYVARAANGAGTAYSAAAFLNVLRPLVITSQPLNRSGFPLTNLSFTVGVSGSSPYAYQWRFNGSNLPNETNSTLLRLSVLPADSGTYTVVITNLISAVTSAPTSLTIWTNPLVTSAPQNQAIMTGSNATFSVVAVSTTPIRYQWYFNTNTLLTDATNSTLLVTNAQLSQVGAYSALLSDDYGSAMSPAGLLFLNLPTFIALHPQPSNVVAFVGSSVSFTAAVAGSPPFFFRWAKNLNAFTNFVQNETNTIFEIPSVQLSNGAAYNIVVTNLVINTNLISRNAYLTVIESLTNQAVPIGTNVTFRFTACTLNTTSTSPSFVLKYRWWFNETNLVFTNNAPNTCTNIFLNLTNVQPSNSGTYLVVATNGVGTVLTQAATLTVMQPPTITQQPADVIVSAGGTVSFDVTADGRPPLSYQWHLGSTPLEGGTASTLLFADAKTDNAGGYRAVVSNPDGSITSAVATLTVIMPPVIVQSPTNQTVRPGSNVTFNIVATGVGLTYQ